MSSEFNRLRVLWPDHLGLARGKYVPASLAETRRASLHRDLGARLRPRHDARDARFALERGPAGLRRQLRDERHSSRVGAGDPGRRGRSHATRRTVRAVAAPRAASRDRRLARTRLPPVRGDGVRGLRLRARRQRGVAAHRHAGRLRLRHRTVGRSPRSARRHLGGLSRRAEIPLESVNSEYDTPQFEFTLRYSDALRAADDGFLFKVLAREVAHRQGTAADLHGQAPVGPRRFGTALQHLVSRRRGRERDLRRRARTTASRRSPSTPSRACSSTTSHWPGSVRRR